MALTLAEFGGEDWRLAWWLTYLLLNYFKGDGCWFSVYNPEGAWEPEQTSDINAVSQKEL